jgi:hypothetical protein
VEFLIGKLNIGSECLSRKPLWDKSDIEDEDVSTFAEVRLENFPNACSDHTLREIFEEA